MLRALGYEPSIAGMDEEDFDYVPSWSSRSPGNEPPPELNRPFRPVDRDFAERIFKMFARPFDPNWQMPNLDGPEYSQLPKLVHVDPQVTRQRPGGQVQNGGGFFGQEQYDPDNELVARAPGYGQGGNATGAEVRPMSGSVGGGGKDGPLGGQNVSATSIPEEMQASENLINFLKSYEKYEEFPYEGQDNYNRTIGYGTVIKPGENYDKGISREEAERKLRQDIAEKFAKKVNEFARNNNIKLTQQQFDALVSFSYNAGKDVWDMSTEDFKIKRMLTEGGNIDPEDLREAFSRWVIVTDKNGRKSKSGGLWRRRQDEWKMFTKGDYNRTYPTPPDDHE